MPVSTGSAVANGDRAAKRCKHCEESSHRVDSGNLFWKIQLDQDLLDTLVAIYPEWFKDYNLTRSPAMAEGGSGGSASSTPDTGPSSPRSHSTQGLLPLSPPKVEVDDSPLQKSMDKNKESLKVKLMMRRPIKMLVDQGIMPPLKTPPAFHEQRQKLERAKMGDLLKAKIQQRPNRQDLVNQHILEDAHVDPSIAEKQRMLKKARLADSLNDQLSHRPGPLELIQKNILHTEEPIERAVKDGVIPFKPTYEGQLTKPQHPNRYITYDEDSLSSEGGQSPLQTQPSTGLPEVRPQADVLEAAAASAGIVTVALTIPTTGGAVVVTSSSPAFRQAVSPVSDQQTATMTFADLCNSVVSPAGSLPTILPSPSPMSLGSTTSSLSPLSSVSSPPTPSPALARRTDAPGKDKNRKKSKSKSQPKTRTIKFHEYKGPPNAHKNLSVNSLPVETPYEILLQQQKLFLQWQLEWQHKYPQIILPASQKPLQVTTGSDMGSSASLSGLITATSPPPQQAVSAVSRPMSVMSPPLVTTQTPASLQEQNQPTQTLTQSLQPQTQPNALRIFGKLEDMKVSDLKAELKRRNLTVSGSKPQLIERLKPFTDTASSTQQTSSDSPQSTTSQTSVSTATSTTIPVSHMGHIVVEAPGSVMSEESLSSFSMDTPVSPNNQQMSLMVEGSVTDDEVSLPNFSPVSQQLSPPPSHQTMSPERDVDMDLSSPQPPPSPRGGEDIIRDQQRKIEELQRELLRSQLQLQQIRSGGKDVVNVVKQPSTPAPQQRAKTGPVVATTTTLPNGVVIDTTLAAKQNQKLVLQQHLQNKIQQQQLQMQLQQLQSLQQQQQQQQLQLQQQRQQQHVAFQQQQQQQGLSAKANLAAFLQNQTQQQQLTNLLQQQVANNNNNNNNNNNKLSTNNKKNTQSIVLGRQQTAIVLNQLKLHRQKAGTVNGVSTHQRTASLPNFLGSFVTQQLQQQRQEHPQQPQQKQRQEHSQQPQQIAELHNTSEAPQFLLTKPPPQYEEATKLLKVKQEATSMCISKSSSKQKNVKSQIVDDVLEILIKNGELPPSAAQDPATPTTPGRSLPQGLIFTASSPAPASPPVPPPPPPPPLPHSSFAITLPTALRLASQTDNNSVQPFQMQATGPEALDLILNSVQPTDGTSEGHQLSSDLQTVAGIDLKELGLDLETLDSMDFGQLDCGDLGVSVKLEPSDLLDVVTDMEVGVETSIKQDDELTLPDQLMNQQELMDIGEMPMDMDDADWLESLMPSDSSAGTSGVEIGSVTTPPHHSSFVLPSTGGINLIQCHTDLDTYDPLLSNSQDPFDLFNIEDSEFKMVGDLTSSLGWDKVDFAT